MTLHQTGLLENVPKYGSSHSTSPLSSLPAISFHSCVRLCFAGEYVHEITEITAITGKITQFSIISIISIISIMGRMIEGEIEGARPSILSSLDMIVTTLVANQ